MTGNPLIQVITVSWKILYRTLSSMWRRSTPQALREDDREEEINGSPSGVDPREEISSFVFKKDQLNRSTNKLHHSRLMPRRNKDTKRLEVSVCRSSELNEMQIWDICVEHFDSYAPTAAIGRGVGFAAAIFDQNLSFDPDGIPYAEHANIIGWHDDTQKPDSELKHYWMNKAQEMAKHFSYMPRDQRPGV